jgi:hypothetical protein
MALTPQERKAGYVGGLASDQGIDLSMLRLLGLLDWTYLSISFNLLFSMYLDLSFVIDLHFDFSYLDFFDINFTDMFNYSFETIAKGRWGSSQYDYFIYDPPDTSPKQLERFVWDLRKHTTETDVPSYKGSHWTLKSVINTQKDIMKSKHVADEYVDSLEETLAWAEGKAMNTAYWGLSIWDLSPWMPSPASPIVYDKRKTDDWHTIVPTETITVYESNWDRSHWNYARWTDLDLVPLLPLEETFRERVDAFHQRTGMVQQYGQPVLNQRVFMLQRREQYHTQGGHHQIVMQNLINNVKDILDQEGVIGELRLSYISYAEEIYYLKYQGHRQYKQWKALLTEDDIKLKYTNMGLDERVLSRVRGVV